MWPCFLLLLAALASRAAGQPSPTANVSTWAELFAAVQGNFTSIRVVSHISYANAPDGINVTNVPLSVFGDAAACAASAAALNKSDFSADPQSFSACTLDAAATWRHFALYPSSGAPVDNTQGVSFSDLSFINGVGVNAVDNTGWLSIGGAIAVTSTYYANFTRCSFTNNTAPVGGALFFGGGVSPNVNQSYGRGEALANIVDCNSALTRSRFAVTANSAPGSGLGGAISTGSIMYVSGSRFVNNSAVDPTGSNPNAAQTGGGAIQTSTLLNLTTSLFDGNSAVKGGAISSTGFTSLISFSTFVNNQAGMGGAISNEAQPLAPIAGYSGPYAAQVLQPDGTLVPLASLAPQPLVVTDSFFGTNSATSPSQPGGCVSTLHVGCGVGGAIHSAYGGVLASTVTLLQRCTFMGNAASSAGGALAVSTLSASDSSFDSNSVASEALAGETAGGGGAIQAVGVYVDTLSLRNVSFGNNTAPVGPGGGVYAVFAPPPAGVAGPTGLFDSCSFVGNSAGAGGGGFAVTGLPMVVRNLTCEGNVATYGDGGCAWLVSLSGAGAVVSGHSFVARNAAPSGTGGGFATTGATQLLLDGATLTANAAAAGGAVGVAGGGGNGGSALVLVAGGSVFTSNTANVGAVFALPSCGANSIQLANVSAVAGNAASVAGGFAFCGSASLPSPAPSAAVSSRAAAAAGIPCGGACAGIGAAGSNVSPNGNATTSFAAASFAPSPPTTRSKPGRLPVVSIGVTDSAGGALVSLPGLAFSAFISNFTLPSPSSAPPSLSGDTLAAFVNGSATFGGLILSAQPGTSAVVSFAPSGAAPGAAAFSLVAATTTSGGGGTYAALARGGAVVATVSPCSQTVEAFDATSMACVCASGAAATVTSIDAGGGAVSSCVACPPGSVSPQRSTLGCLPCGVGTYAAPGGATCTPCPSGSTTLGGVGGTSLASCACLSGYTRVSSGNASSSSSASAAAPNDFTCAQAPAPAPLLSRGGAGGVAAGAAVCACLAAAAAAVYVRRLRAAAADAKSKGWIAYVALRCDIELGKRLGSGGSATVYAAKWKGAPVAIKEFDRGMPSQSTGTGEAAAAEKDERTSPDGGGALEAGLSSPPVILTTSSPSPRRAAPASSPRPSRTPLLLGTRGARLRGAGAPTPPPIDSMSDPSFAREVQFLSSLRHPNLLAMYAVSPGPRPWLIMELGGAGSLKDLLQRTSLATLPWLSRVGLGAGVAAGVAFLHDQRPPVVHKDLKSANVLLDDALVPKVGDFGISAFGHEQPAGAQGTPRFMAPELFLSQSACAGGAPLPLDMTAVDVFGLGFILHDLCHVHTGAGHAHAPPPPPQPPQPAPPALLPAPPPAPPAHGATTTGTHPLAIIMQRAKGGWEVSLAPGLDPDMADLLSCCLATSPGNRPTALRAGERLRRMAAASVGWGPTDDGGALSAPVGLDDTDATDSTTQV